MTRYFVLVETWRGLGRRKGVYATRADGQVWHVSGEYFPQYLLESRLPAVLDMPEGEGYHYEDVGDHGSFSITEKRVVRQAGRHAKMNTKVNAVRSEIERFTEVVVPYSVTARVALGRPADFYVAAHLSYDNIGGHTVGVYAAYRAPGRDEVLFQLIGWEQDGIGPDVPSWVWCAEDAFRAAVYDYATYGVETFVMFHRADRADVAGFPAMYNEACGSVQRSIWLDTPHYKALQYARARQVVHGEGEFIWAWQ